MSWNHLEQKHVYHCTVKWFSGNKTVKYVCPSHIFSSAVGFFIIPGTLKDLYWTKLDKQKFTNVKTHLQVNRSLALTVTQRSCKMSVLCLSDFLELHHIYTNTNTPFSLRQCLSYLAFVSLEMCSLVSHSLPTHFVSLLTETNVASHKAGQPNYYVWQFITCCLAFAFWIL